VRIVLRVDDGRLGSAQPVDFAIAADSQDLVSSNRDRLGHRPVAIGGIDCRVVHDQIDRPIVVVALGANDQSRD
jgi:hypothetical protein